ncbi:hypothetical protein TRVA0_036S00232 [Trichomonascus vanleenenianus]|uniref:guanine nucleotide exchange factor SEC2 n=1 Tax=Trichomonascus vanleenenianus TaxID=2268995 RepID=UPI003ECB06DD
MADVDLSAEVTALSTRLIQAIDRQADLEDQVQVLRRELDTARRDKMSLEDTMKEMATKEEVAEAFGAKRVAEERYDRLQKDSEELSARLFEDANQRVAAANRETAMIAKRNNQLELQLTEKDTLLENMQQQLAGLKTVLQDLTEQEEQHALQDKRESLNVSIAQYYQQQLMSAPSAEQSDKPSGLQPSPLDRNAGVSSSSEQQQPSDDYYSMPSTPTQQARGGEEYSLSSFVRPTLRLDLQAFSEFNSLSQHHKHVMAIREQYGTPKSHSPPPASPGVLNTPKYHLGFSGASGLLGSSVNSTPDNSRTQYTPPSLKEFRFFKRTLSDDIEPTLRLDQSPNLSWLARRSLMAAIIEGTVVVEPISGINEGYKFGGGDLYSHVSVSGSGTDTPNSTHLYAYPQGGPPVATKAPCKLCGESRTGSLLYARMHNLRIVKNSGETSVHSASNSFSGGMFGITPTNSNTANDSASIATSTSTSTSINNNNSNNNSSSNNGGSNGEDVVSLGYPLCYYCLNRVRSVCDFIAFMKSVRDGVWRIDDKDKVSQMRAWEECSKLRERMFWARLGGCFTGMPITPIGMPRKKASVLTSATSEEYMITSRSASAQLDESEASSPGDATVTEITTVSTTTVDDAATVDDTSDGTATSAVITAETSSFTIVTEGTAITTPTEKIADAADATANTNNVTADNTNDNDDNDTHANNGSDKQEDIELANSDDDSGEDSGRVNHSGDNALAKEEYSGDNTLAKEEYLGEEDNTIVKEEYSGDNTSAKEESPAHGSSEEDSAFIDAYDYSDNYDSDGIEVAEVSTAEKVQLGRPETK